MNQPENDQKKPENDQQRKDLATRTMRLRAAAVKPHLEFTHLEFATGMGKKKAPTFVEAKRIWQLPTLPHCCAVPSAMAGLTSLFGMGRGEHRRQYHHNILGLSTNKIDILGQQFCISKVIKKD